jgi:hypothetical protein
VIARLAIAFFLPLLALAPAAKVTTATARAENEDIMLTVTMYVEPSDIKALLGNDLGAHYIVASVKAEPKYGKEVTIDRDDFVLRTDKDGEKSTPFTGSQIAGKEALIIQQTTSMQGIATPGWSVGGAVIVGGAAKDKDKDKDKDEKPVMKTDETASPLKKLLDERILQSGKTEKPVTGLLYFPMEKQKMKNLELQYGGKENRISLRFKN